MGRPTAARSAAFETLRAVRAGTFADIAFHRAADRLDSRDRAWAQELVYSTLRLRGRLDHMLAHVSSRPLDALDPDVLDILRLGACQIVVMGGVPAYAAVSESVEMVRGVARSAAGFVNAVLQTLRREPDGSTFPALEADPVGHLSSWGSHPRWLVERWVARYGADGTARLIAANNQRPDLHIRALDDRDRVAARLRDAGVATEPVAFAPAALRVVEGAVTAALEAAPVIVQDPAAGLVVDYALGRDAGSGPVAGSGPATQGGVVLDLAAAPGGKALAMEAGFRARGMYAQGVLVVAADRSARRLKRLTESVRRLARPEPEGLGRAGVVPVVADARWSPFRPAAVVLLDAPCTGTGTLRRHPDGRWRIRPADLDALVVVQRDMLDAAAAVVEPGGLLVYSTCSLEPEENEMQVADFLRRHDGFVVERGDGVDDAMISEVGAMHVLPQDTGVDGAYAVRLRRAAAPLPGGPHAG